MWALIHKHRRRGSGVRGGHHGNLVSPAAGARTGAARPGGGSDAGGGGGGGPGAAGGGAPDFRVLGWRRAVPKGRRAVSKSRAVSKTRGNRGGVLGWQGGLKGQGGLEEQGGLKDEGQSRGRSWMAGGVLEGAGAVFGWRGAVSKSRGGPERTGSVSRRAGRSQRRGAIAGAFLDGGERSSRAGRTRRTGVGEEGPRAGEAVPICVCCCGGRYSPPLVLSMILLCGAAHGRTKVLTRPGHGSLGAIRLSE